MTKTGGEMHQFFLMYILICIHRWNLNTDEYLDFYLVRGKSKKSNLDFYSVLHLDQ